MEWINKHVDTIIILGGVLASVLWMNGKFGDVDKRFNEMEKDIVVIKTTLILKNILPRELAKEARSED